MLICEESSSVSLFSPFFSATRRLGVLARSSYVNRLGRMLAARLSAQPRDEFTRRHEPHIRLQHRALLIEKNQIRNAIDSKFLRDVAVLIDVNLDRNHIAQRRRDGWIGPGAAPHVLARPAPTGGEIDQH